MKPLLWGLAIIFPYCAATQALSDSVGISRDEVIERLSRNASIQEGGIPGLDAAAEVFLLERIRAEIRARGEGMLPETLTVSSKDRVEQVLEVRLRVSEADPAYNAAAIEECFHAVQVRVAFEKLAMPLSADVRSALVSNVKALRLAMQDSINKHLASYYSAETIIGVLDRIESERIAKIGNPISYALRVPVTEKDVAEIGGEFDVRLQESVKRVAARLAAAEEIADPEARAKHQAEIGKAALVEIITKGYSVLNHRTSDRKLAAVDPDTLDPGYTESVRRRVEFARKLAIEKKERHEAEAKRAELAARRGKEHEVIKEVLDPAVEDLGADVSWNSREGELGPVEVAVSEGSGCDPAGDDRRGGRPQAKTNMWWCIAVVSGVIILGGYFVAYRRLRGSRGRGN